MSLEGKRILVTGGGSGLGRYYVENFRKQGAKVVYGDLSENGDVPGYIHCDVTSWESQLSMFKNAVEQLGQLDVVIANAGIGGHEEFNEFEDVDVDPPTRPRTAVIAVNVIGVLYTSKLAMHQFAKQQKAGKNSGDFKPILIIGGSLAGYMDIPAVTVYNTSKFGARGLLHGLRHTAPRIKARVTMVAPWHVETPMLSEAVGYLKGRGILMALIEDVFAAAEELAKNQDSNGKCFAIVPREIASKGYLDVDEKGHEKFWKEYNDILISEDVRPPPNF